MTYWDCCLILYLKHVQSTTIQLYLIKFIAEDLIFIETMSYFNIIINVLKLVSFFKVWYDISNTLILPKPPGQLLTSNIIISCNYNICWSWLAILFVLVYSPHSKKIHCFFLYTNLSWTSVSTRNNCEDNLTQCCRYY